MARDATRASDARQFRRPRGRGGCVKENRFRIVWYELARVQGVRFDPSMELLLDIFPCDWIAAVPVVSSTCRSLSATPVHQQLGWLLGLPVVTAAGWIIATFRRSKPPSASENGNPKPGEILDGLSGLGREDWLRTIEASWILRGESDEEAEHAAKRLADASKALEEAADEAGEQTIAVALSEAKAGRTTEAERILRAIQSEREREGNNARRDASEAARHRAAFVYLNDRARA